MLQQRHNFFVLHLRKVLVELPNGLKVIWHRKANHLVGQWPDVLQCLAGRHRECAHQLGRCLLPDGAERGHHGRARGQTIVHHDHQPPLAGDGFLYGGVALASRPQHFQLPRLFGLHIRGRGAQVGRMRAQPSPTGFVDGANGHFRVKG